MGEPGFRQRLWETLHADEWSKDVDDEEEYLLARVRGVLAETERAKVAADIWRDMFTQIREVAVNYAPVVAHCQPAEHVFALCRDSKRFELEVDRRIHRPSEAIEIRRTVGVLYTTDEAERERRREE